MIGDFIVAVIVIRSIGCVVVGASVVVVVVVVVVLLVVLVVVVVFGIFDNAPNIFSTL